MAWLRRKTGTAYQIGRPFKVSQSSYASDFSNRGKVMPAGLQIAKLKDYFKKQGLETDLFDFESEVDPNLNYEENLKAISKKLGKGQQALQTSEFSSKRKQKEIKEQLDRETLEFEKKQSKHYFESRSEKSKEQDLNKQAKATITDREIIRNPEALKQWYKSPNRFDIEGVDDK